MKRIILILVILAWISPAFTQVNSWGYGHGIVFQIVTDTTSIDKTLGKLYFYTGDSTMYMGGGTYLNQAANFNELAVETSLEMTGSVSGSFNINGSGGSTIPLKVDGNKTSGNLAQFINDNDGSVGDSSGIITAKGVMVLGGSAASAGMAGGGGISINQGANDDNILEFKSSDVTHGITSVCETDVYAVFKKRSGPAGGLQMLCLSDAASAGLSISGIVSAEMTGADYAFQLTAGLKNGTSLQVLGATSKVLGIANYTSYLFSVLGGGQIGIGTAAPLANSLTLGTKATQRDLLVTMEATPAGTDSSYRAWIDDGNGKTYHKAGDGDSLVATCNNSYAVIKSNNTIVQSVFNYFADTSTVNDSYGFVCADIAAYTTGMVLYVKAGVANTAGCTLQINALGAKDIKTTGIDDPPNSYIEAGTVMHLIYDGTQFQLMSPDANP